SHLRQRDGERGRAGEPAARGGREPRGRPDRQLRERLLPERSLLFPVRPHGPDPAHAPPGPAGPEPDLMSFVSRLFAGRSSWTRALVVLVFLAAAISVPQLGSLFYVSLASNFLIFGLLAMSLDLLAGYTGLVSLGQAAMLGIGAYAVAVAMARGVDANVSVVLALLASLAVASVFGLLAVRVGGVTFV